MTIRVQRVVSYRNSTSNHNCLPLSNSPSRVVSYRNSTSNHNVMPCLLHHPWLYLIEILHQTTTVGTAPTSELSCILSKFYIKPQRHLRRRRVDGVVSYRNSTSNHNVMFGYFMFGKLYLIEILHQTTTGVRRDMLLEVLYLIEILHQTTTSSETPFSTSRLYLIEILHQTTTDTRDYIYLFSCILSKFYIKPQPWATSPGRSSVVSYRNSTSNHNVGPHID